MSIGQGHIGALSVLSQIGEDDTALLTTNEIYGERIWILFKYVCQERLPVMHLLLQATKLGVVSKQQLNTAVDNHVLGLNLRDIANEVTVAMLKNREMRF